MFLQSKRIFAELLFLRVTWSLKEMFSEIYKSLITGHANK